MWLWIVIWIVILIWRKWWTMLWWSRFGFLVAWRRGRGNERRLQPVSADIQLGRIATLDVVVRATATELLDRVTGDNFGAND